MTDLQALDQRVDKAIASGDEKTLRSAFYDLFFERDARTAAAANDAAVAHVAHVAHVATLQRRVADEVSRLREDRIAARVAAAKALAVPELPPPTPKRFVRHFEPRRYVRRR